MMSYSMGIVIDAVELQNLCEFEEVKEEKSFAKVESHLGKRYS